MLNTALWIPYYLAIALALLAFLGFVVSLFQVTQEKARRPERAPTIVEWNPINAVFFAGTLTAYGLRARRRIALFGLCTLVFVGLAFCCLLMLKLAGE